MEMLRQEIIGQEHVFRSQVRELHRLYWTQKNMMIELCENGINAHASEDRIALSESSRGRNGGYALDGSAGNLLMNNSRIFNLKIPAYDFTVGPDTKLSMSSRAFQSDCGNGVTDIENSMDVQHCIATESSSGGFRTQALCLFGSQLTMIGNDDSAITAVNDIFCSKHGSRPLPIDLNTPNEDERYYVQNDHIVRIASPVNFSFDHHQILEPEITKSYAKSSFTSKPESTIPASITSYKNGAKWSFPLNQDSVALASQVSTLAHNNMMDSSAKRTKLVSTHLSSTYEEDSYNLSQIISRDSTDKPRNHDGSEDVPSSHSAAQDEAQPDEFSRNSCAEYNSIAIINNSECSSYDKEPATLSITDDSMITQLHSPKHEISCIVNPKIEVRDVAIAAAAEALMNITFGRLEHFENSLEVEARCDEPQKSSESFEFMPMQLCDVQNEVQSSMAETSRLNETQKDANRVRLQRGRRLRDFRKEILPGLVSLSRHEICEDLYNIGYTLRKNTPKNARKNWFLPIRSRRSRSYLQR